MKSNIFNRLTASTKEVIAFGVVTALSLVSMTQTAHARLIFTTEDEGVNADAYHLDYDDTSADFIDLAFGSGVGSMIRYDILNSKFIINQNLDLAGNELLDFIVENQNDANEPTCDAAAAGRMYYNTTNNVLLFCNGTTWVSTESDLSGLAGNGLVNAGGGALDVNVDDSTIEINADVVRVKDGGITSNKILDGTIATADIAAGAITGGLNGVIADGSITADDLATNSVTSDEIATDAVGSDEIAADAVTASEIATDAVTTDEILDGTIATADIAAGAITGGLNGVIADGSITADDLATNSVTSDEIAADAVTASEIATDAVGSDEIATDAVTASEIATDAVTTDEILDGTIATADIASGGNDKLFSTDSAGNVTWIDKSTISVPTLTSGQMIVGDANGDATAVTITGDASISNTGVLSLTNDSVTASEIATDAVGSDEIATDAVGSDEIATDAVGSDEIATDAVGSDEIAADAVTASEIATDAVGSDEIAADAVTASEIATDAVGSDEIATDAVTASEIATGAVTTDEILDGTIATADIAAGAITGGLNGVIADGSITADDLATNSVTSDEIATDAVGSDEIATGAVTTTEILDGTIALDDIAERSYIQTISPEFPEFTIQADGSDNKGRLLSDHDSTNHRNYYEWSTKKTTEQDYDLLVQWTVPEGFQSFNANSLSFDYKTATSSAADGEITLVEAFDTTGTTIAGVTTNSGASTTWATISNIDLTGGTFTPGQAITLRFRMKSRATAGEVRQPSQLGSLKLQYNVK